jgi:hypothetical protein
MSKKLQILIDAGEGAMQYGIALGHEKIPYHERMNEQIILMLDGIVSSIMLSCLLQAAAYLAESRKWKKMSTIWTAAERANRYYRIANVFIYTALLTLVDVGLNEGIESLAQYTGIEMLGDLQVGHIAALTFINGCTGYEAVITLRDDAVNGGFKLLRLIGRTAKQMINDKRIVRKKGFIVNRVKKDKTHEMKSHELKIMSKRSTVETRQVREENRKRQRMTDLEPWKREMIQQIIDL